MVKLFWEEGEGTIDLDDPQLGLQVKESFSPLRLPRSYEEGQVVGQGQVVVVWEGDEETFVRTAFVGKGGRPCGEHLTYHSNGQIAHQSFYSEEEPGQLHGPARSYCSEGNLLSEGLFIRGRRQGRGVDYYPSGAVYSICSYKNGKKEGEQKIFFEGGELKTLIPYLSDCMHGQVQLYHDNGLLKRQTGYLHGQREGLDQIWDRKGTLTCEKEFERGKALRERFWSPRGILLEEQVHRAEWGVRDVIKWDIEGTRRYELVYDSLGNRCERVWDEHGVLLEEEGNCSNCVTSEVS